MTTSNATPTRGFVATVISAVSSVVLGAMTLTGCQGGPEVPETFAAREVSWISSVTDDGGMLRIAVDRSSSSGETEYLTGASTEDYKSVLNADGSKVAFFRIVS